MVKVMGRGLRYLFLVRILAIIALTILAACSPPSGFGDVLPIDAHNDATDIARTPIGTSCGLDPNGEALGGCSAGETCLSPTQGFPNGYCAQDCLRDACPDGTTCYPLDSTHRYCIQRCSTDADCRRADGYVCIPPRPGAAPTCLPNPEPIGRRADGSACFTSIDRDAGSGPFLAPLPPSAFVTPPISASRERVGTLEETEPSIAIDPSAMHPMLVAYAGYALVNMVPYWRGGISRIASDGSIAGATMIRDADFPDVDVVNTRYDRTGRAHLAFVARNTDRPGNPVRYAASDDGAITFTRAASIFPETHCLLACDAPSFAIGARANGVDALFVTATRAVGEGTELSFATALASDAMFAAPLALASLEHGTTARRAPRVSTVVAGSEPGVVIASWYDESLESGVASLGDRENRVRLRRSVDDGVTFAATVEVARSTDLPVRFAPAAAAAPGVIHVAYVTGGLLGVWDVILATSTDDGAHFTYRVVNDDEPCATHGWPSIAADPATGDVDVLFVDNRFGPGEVVVAHCPRDGSQRCGRNQSVSVEPFALTTGLDPTRWIGTRTALVRAADGTLWAAWSDPRFGTPGVYVSHAP